MKNLISFFSLVLLCLISVSCDEADKREGVSKSKTFKYHCDLEMYDRFKSFDHTIYIGNYIIKSKEDTLSLLAASMKYVDTASYSTPIQSLTFVNNIENFPKALDDQNADELRKKYIFTVHFDKDSLIKKKYFIDSYSTWSKGKPISLAK